MSKSDPRHIRLRELLRQARKNAKISQVEVAARLGKPQSYMSKMERGEKTVDAIELMELAKLYGKPLDFFAEACELEGDIVGGMDDGIDHDIET